MNFKDRLKKDLDSVFFNEAEFSSVHDIDGERLSVIVDNDRLTERKIKDDIENIQLADILFFVEKDSIGYIPRVETTIRFDSVLYRVGTVNNDAGMLEITLIANTSR